MQIFSEHEPAMTSIISTIELLPEPLVIIDKSYKVFYENKSAKLLANKKPNLVEQIETISGLCIDEIIRKPKDLKIVISKNNYNVEIVPLKTQQGYYIIWLKDINIEVEYLEELIKLRQLNKELQAVFEHYADTIYITNGRGKTLRAGKDVARNCGVSVDYLKGKHVKDLEDEGVFYPSVILKVLETKAREIVIQSTLAGKTLVSVGIPIIGHDNTISKVIAISRDITGQIEIGNHFTKIKDIPEPKHIENLPDFVTCSAKIQNILGLVELVSKVDSTVLLTGESGTGKDLLAKYIHASSKRKKNPFITINCGSISSNIVESELFGYEAGSFTGASKDGKVGLIEAGNHGTVFLNEISELPLEQQVKILQVIQEKLLTRVGGRNAISLDIRFIAATNKDLELLVKLGAFREDLFYRLNVVPINIPPLRDRKEDIPFLIQHFLSILNKKYQHSKQFSRDALDIMCNYNWPGNVREVENAVERLLVTTNNAIIEAEHLPEYVFIKNKKSKLDIIINSIVPLKDAVCELEILLIEKAIAKYGSANKAARMLNIDQSTLSRKIKKYEMTRFLNE